MSAPAFNYVGWKHGADLGGQGGLGVFIAPTEGITVDVQAAEVLYRNAEIKPVPDSMSAFADFETVFGKEALQCAWRFHHKHRKWVEIIGENHELLEWDEPSKDDQGVGAPTTNGDLDYTYMGVKFSRPFHWYLEEDADPAVPPPNDGEKWIVDLLKPVLEGMYVEKRRGGREEGRRGGRNNTLCGVWCVVCVVSYCMLIQA